MYTRYFARETFKFALCHIVCLFLLSDGASALPHFLLSLLQLLFMRVCLPTDLLEKRTARKGAELGTGR